MRNYLFQILSLCVLGFLCQQGTIFAQSRNLDDTAVAETHSNIKEFVEVHCASCHDSSHEFNLEDFDFSNDQFSKSTFDSTDVPLMKLLLELGADPMETNVDNCNALMAAAGIGVIAVGEEPGTEEEVCAAVRLLHGLGVEINAVDKNKETAMHGAAYRTFPLVVELLDELGAEPAIWSKKNRHGWTPRDIATGKRPGSIKPSPETIEAIDKALQ